MGFLSRRRAATIGATCVLLLGAVIGIAVWFGHVRHSGDDVVPASAGAAGVNGEPRPANGAGASNSAAAADSAGVSNGAGASNGAGTVDGTSGADDVDAAGGSGVTDSSNVGSISAAVDATGTAGASEEEDLSQTSDWYANNNGSDHRSHAVAGDEYVVRDWDGDGQPVAVELDGERSHTHYFNAATAEFGSIVSYQWVDTATGKVLLSEAKGTVDFPVGITTVALTVIDSTGDANTAETVVEVRSTTEAGAFCYAFDQSPSKKSLSLGATPTSRGLRPVGGAGSADLDFSRGLPEEMVPPDDVSAIGVLCRSTITGGAQGGRLSLRATGIGPVALQVRDQSAGPSTDGVVVELDLDAGEAADFEVLYLPLTAPGAGAPGISTVAARVGGRVAVDGDAVLTYDLTATIPILITASVAESKPDGGGAMVLNGAGLFDNDLVVRLGGVPADVEELDKAGSRVQVRIPPGLSGQAPITISTGAGLSNSLPFAYAEDAQQAVVFTDSLMTIGGSTKTLKLNQPTSIALGPDGRAYIGRRQGVVTVLTINHANLIVSSVCESEPLAKRGPRREALGVAFNPMDRELVLYVSSSVLDWKSKKGLPQEWWDNGEVVTMVPASQQVEAETGACMVVDKTIVRGLPISSHDHGVNGIVFPNSGNMLVAIGGTTNAGFPHPKLGNVDESPLSAAIVYANIRRPGFNGNVTYDQMEDESTARITSGRDVRVYASGVRNCFGMVAHSNGHVYATDNGPSDGFGKRSVTCTTSDENGQTDLDKLLDVTDGAYFGHPNRNRGRDDPVQCTHFATDAPPHAKVSVPMTLFPTSTDGLVEWGLNVFPSLRGSLLASKFAANSDGLLFQVPLTENGRAVEGTGEPNTLYPKSGVAISLHPSGVIMMPRVIHGDVLLLRPTFFPPSTKTPFVSGVMPERGRRGGGQPLTVIGWHLADAVAVSVGGQPCEDIREVAPDGRSLQCTTPPGRGNVAVVVTTRRGGRSPSSGREFRYMFS